MIGAGVYAYAFESESRYEKGGTDGRVQVCRALGNITDGQKQHVPKSTLTEDEDRQLCSLFMRRREEVISTSSSILDPDNHLKVISTPKRINPRITTSERCSCDTHT